VPGPVRQAMLMLAPSEAKTKLLRTAREKGDLAWRGRGHRGGYRSPPLRGG